MRPRRDRRSTPWIPAGAVAITALQMLFTYMPSINYAFGSESIGWPEWALILGVGFVIGFAVGVQKWLRRRASDSRAVRFP